MMHIFHPERCASFGMKDAHHLHFETAIQNNNIAIHVNITKT